MKGIIDWIFTQAVSTSFASARPFSGTESFTSERPLDDESDNNAQTHRSVIPAVQPGTTYSSPNVMENLDTERDSFGYSHPLNQNHGGKKMDPLSKLEDIRVKFLRAARRLGQAQDSPLVAKVLYRMHLGTLLRAEESDLKRVNLQSERAKAVAKEQEASGIPELDFSLKILLLGKTGVGKSATINSIFDQLMAKTNAFKPSTDHIREVTGNIGGIKITFIDTPGFFPLSAGSAERRNRKIMLSIKSYIKKSPPDVVLYFDRLDLISMPYSDSSLLKLMSEIFGPSFWFSTMLVLTHSTTIPEGPSGFQISYESYVKQCTDIMQHHIHQTINDSKLENPVLLVENHPHCKKNSTGEYILPNGQVWKSQFLLLCISSKVLSDANALLKFGDSIELGSVGATRLPSLPHLLSSFLRRHIVANPNEPETDVEELLLSEMEEEDPYDQLPPFRVLTKSQFSRLSKSQKTAYLDELDYREALYLKKQLKEECQKRREKKLWKDVRPVEDGALGEMDSYEAVPLPDMVIPSSFGSDYPVHRYRSFATTDQWIVRPVLDPQGWDNDVGFDGLNLEAAMELRNNLFASVNGQMSKDKQSLNIQSESSTTYAHPNGPAYSLGIDLQSSGRDMIYSIYTNTKLKNLKHNTTDLGFSLLSFRKNCYVGAKFEDSLLVGERLKFIFNAGQMRGPENMAFGGSIEAVLRGQEYLLKKDFIGLTMTALSYNKQLVLGGALQSEFQPFRNTKLSVNVNMNSQKIGQISLKANSSEHLEIALFSAFTLFKSVLRRMCRETSG